jgi:hypothetical protein
MQVLQYRQFPLELDCNSGLPSILTQVLQYRQFPLELDCNSGLPSILTHAGTTVQAVPIGTRLQLKASINTYSGTTEQAVPVVAGYSLGLPSIPTQVLQYRQYPLELGCSSELLSIPTHAGTTVQAVPIGTRLQLRASINTYSGTTVQAVPIGTRPLAEPNDFRSPFLAKCKGLLIPSYHMYCNHC